MNLARPVAATKSALLCVSRVKNTSPPQRTALAMRFPPGSAQMERGGDRFLLHVMSAFADMERDFSQNREFAAGNRPCKLSTPWMICKVKSTKASGRILILRRGIQLD